MPYEFLEDIAVADAAFKAWGDTLEEMFISAAEATMNVMVAELDTIEDKERRKLHADSDAVDMLLFQLLQEIIFYKDAERLLLRINEIHLEGENSLRLSADAYGEELNPERHDLIVDVKAVTLHRFKVEHTASDTWEAIVILDV
ncbi:MAG: archease [Syntrophobacteraceae bacterium]